MSIVVAKSPIVNRTAPILIIAYNLTISEHNIQTKLRYKGLISKVTDAETIVKEPSLSKYSMIVTLMESVSDIADLKYRNRAKGKNTKHLFINVGQDNHYDKDVETISDIEGNDYDYLEADRNTEEVASVILEYFENNVDLTMFPKASKPEDYTPNLKDLILRLDVATDAIQDMRLNSTGEIIDELRIVSKTLRSQLEDRPSSTVITQQELRVRILETLRVVARLFDYIENSKLASIVVSGATTAIMGCSGYSAALSLTIMLASWHGKDTFLAALDKVKIPVSDGKQITPK